MIFIIMHGSYDLELSDYFDIDLALTSVH